MNSSPWGHIWRNSMSKFKSCKTSSRATLAIMPSHESLPLLQCVCGVLQCGAVCCNKLQSTHCNHCSAAVCCSHCVTRDDWIRTLLWCPPVNSPLCCSVLQCVVMCCSVLPCIAVCCNELQCGSVLQSLCCKTWLRATFASMPSRELNSLLT